METITFNLGSRKQFKYESTSTEGQILVAYLEAVKEKNLHNLVSQMESYEDFVDIPNYLIGAYKAKGYEVEKYSKGDGTYRAEVIPDLVFQLAREKHFFSWERIEE